MDSRTLDVYSTGGSLVTVATGAGFDTLVQASVSPSERAPSLMSSNQRASNLPQASAPTLKRESFCLRQNGLH